MKKNRHSKKRLIFKKKHFSDLEKRYTKKNRKGKKTKKRTGKKD